MSYWIVILTFAFGALSSAWALWLTIRLQIELKSSLVIDWGPQPKRAYSLAIVAIAAWMVWSWWKDTTSGSLFVLLLMAMIVLIAIRVALVTFRHFGIYKEGMLVLKEILSSTTGQFIRWSEIQDYRWEEQGRLVINSGSHSITCRIKPEMVDDLRAVLKEKCPEAELEIQNVEP